MRRKHWPRHGGLGLGLSVGGGGVAYLLNDSFLTDKAAGSVNGTAAEPGPGTRTVVDVDGDLIISSGYLKQANLVNVNSTRCYYSAITYVQGRMLLAKTNPTGDERYSGLKVDNNLTIDVNDGYGITYDTGTNLRIDNGAVNAIINSFDHTEDQLFGMVFGVPSGGNVPVYYMHKAGAANWYIMFKITILEINVYPYANIYKTSVCPFKFIRVPTMLWTPRPISADAFSGTWPTTDGGGLTGLEAGGSGKTWTTAVGATWSNAGGFAVNAPGVGGELVTNGDFSAWLGDNPDWWTLSVAEDANNYVTENPAGQCQIVCDNSVGMGIYKAGVGTNNKWYRLSIDIKNVTLGGIKIGFTPQYGYGTTGVKTFTQRCGAATVLYGALRVAACDITVDDISCKLLTAAELIQVIDNGVNDFYAEIDITAAAGFQAGIVFNYTDASNFEVVYLNRNDEKVYWDQCVAGTYTNINTSAAVTPGSGYKLAVRRIGTSLYYWYNNIYVHNNTIVSTLNTTSQGLFSTGNGATEVKFDNWKLYAVGSGGEYSLLDMFCN